MSVQTMRQTREGKYFYRNGLRRVAWLLMASLILNGVFILGIYNKLVTRPEPTYYSTSGVKPPIRLTARLKPNYSSEALLPPDPPVSANESMLTQ